MIGRIWRGIPLYSPAGEYNNKVQVYKMATSRFVQITDKEINEIEINAIL